MRKRTLHDRWPLRFLKGGESGQALVEMALSLPLFVLLLLGAVEFGRLAYAAIEVSNAARAAVAFADQNHAYAFDTTGMQNAAQVEYTINPSALSVATPTYTCTCSDSGASVDCFAAGVCTGAQRLETITVQTSATFDPIIHLPGLPTSFTLYGQAVQAVLQ
jgi:Flp pilus assembly protein TadG